mmetsp:Transcript_9047/g.25469  ORF Transcript_9047/g.25469 Transcript_9047/m.25469 type:complete len:235 (-) Transcript_9047:291-995(-)
MCVHVHLSGVQCRWRDIGKTAPKGLPSQHHTGTTLVGLSVTQEDGRYIVRAHCRQTRPGHQILQHAQVALRDSNLERLRRGHGTGKVEGDDSPGRSRRRLGLLVHRGALQEHVGRHGADAHHVLSALFGDDAHERVGGVRGGEGLPPLGVAAGLGRRGGCSDGGPAGVVPLGQVEQLDPGDELEAAGVVPVAEGLEGDAAGVHGLGGRRPDVIGEPVGGELGNLGDLGLGIGRH